MPGSQEHMLAFVFTDIEGSSQLWERHSGAFLKAMEAHDRLLCDLCRDLGGQVVKNEGDAFFLVFREGPAALRFTLRGQEMLRDYDWSQHLPDTLLVRMGLHYGSAWKRDEDYFGPEVNRTARLCEAGHGGQILASEEFMSACGELPSEIVITDLQRHRLRGLAQPQRILQLTGSLWERREWPALRTLDEVPTNLPAQVTSFVGRESDLEEMAALLSSPDVRLITMTGAGGSGKSRLAQEAAARALQHYPDGVFWVELAHFTSPEAVPGAVMSALKLQPNQHCEACEQIAEHLRGRRLLLVLDNFEQVIDAAEFVECLLRQSPDARLLITSREVLRVPGEHVFEVLPLSIPEPPVNYETLSQYDSVHLFLHRARAVAHDFEITVDNAAAVAEICHRLDGIPLALELAAAWTRVYTPVRILQRLGGRSEVLTSRVRGVSERQRTVSDTIDWSYRMLSAEEQRVLRRLSVFRGGFFLEAAEDVCGADAVESIMTLHDKSLLYSKEVLGRKRLQMLETIREFAAERLVAEGQEDDARAAHLAWSIECADELVKCGDQRADSRYWALLTLEAPNVEDAILYATRSGRLEGGELLFEFLFWLLYTSSAAAQRLLPLVDEAIASVPGCEGQLWTAAAAIVRLVCFYHGQRFAEGLSFADEAYALADAAGSDYYRRRCAFFAVALAKYASRAECGRWSREQARWVETPLERALLSRSLVDVGETLDGLTQVDLAMRELQSISDPYARWQALSAAMYTYLQTEHYARGAAWIPEQVQLVRGPLHDHIGVITYGWQNAVPLAARNGDAGYATDLAREQMARLQALEPGLRATRRVTALVMCACGDLWEVAAELAEEYLGPWPIVDLPSGNVLGSGLGMAAIYARAGATEQALSAIAPYLQSDCCLDGDRGFLQVGNLKSAAEVLRACGNRREAVVVASVASRLQALWPLRHRLCEELLALLADEVPADEFARARAESETMSGAAAFALVKSTLQA